MDVFEDAKLLEPTTWDEFKGVLLARPLNEDELQLLPKDDICPVCMVKIPDLLESGRTMMMPRHCNCKLAYCDQCILAWMRHTGGNCPTCKEHGAPDKGQFAFMEDYVSPHAAKIMQKGYFEAEEEYPRFNAESFELTAVTGECTAWEKAMTEAINERAGYTVNKSHLNKVLANAAAHAPLAPFEHRRARRMTGDLRVEMQRRVDELIREQMRICRQAALLTKASFGEHLTQARNYLASYVKDWCSMKPMAESLYVVDSIFIHEYEQGTGLWYFVRYLGLPHEQGTWEREDDLFGKDGGTRAEG